MQSFPACHPKGRFFLFFQNCNWNFLRWSDTNCVKHVASTSQFSGRQNNLYLTLMMTLRFVVLYIEDGVIRQSAQVDEICDMPLFITHRILWCNCVRIKFSLSLTAPTLPITRRLHKKNLNWSFILGLMRIFPPRPSACIFYVPRGVGYKYQQEFRYWPNRIIPLPAIYTYGYTRGKMLFR